MLTEDSRSPSSENATYPDLTAVETHIVTAGYSDIVTLEDRAVTLGTVSNQRKFDILVHFLILLKEPSFHNQQKQLVLSPGGVVQTVRNQAKQNSS